MSHVRTIGPDDNGHEVVLRHGDRLDVVPVAHPHGWLVTELPADVVTLLGSPDAASSHTFVAVAIGTGNIVLRPASPAPDSIGVFTVRIRVMREVIQPVLP
jgi:hypothetical protein